MTNRTRVTLQEIANSVQAPLDQITKVILGQPGVSDDLRRRVGIALEEAGLVRLSRETRTGSLGVVVPGAVIGDYIGEVVRGVIETAKKQDYSVILDTEKTEDEIELVQMLSPGGCTGVIAVVPKYYARVLELCRYYQCPYVLIDYQGEDDLSDGFCVEVNNAQGIEQLMNYLFKLGHRRIGFISGLPQHASARQRLEGYAAALQTAGIAYDAAFVRGGNWFHESGCEQTLALLQLDAPPTAIVASNDMMAFGAMQAGHELGLEIGVDLSIAGFDDIDMASNVVPPLTSVRQPMAGMGEAAVNLLVRLNRGEKIAQSRIQLDTELIVRQSTGARSALKD